MSKLSNRIVYSLLSGTVYATTIAIIDYFKNKDFDLAKFVL